MLKICSIIAISALLLQLGQPPVQAKEASYASQSEQIMERTGKDCVLERKFKFRSRLNTQLFTKKMI